MNSATKHIANIAKEARKIKKATVHSIDENTVNLQIGNSPNLIKNVEVSGDISTISAGQEVTAIWVDGRPVVFAGGNYGGSAIGNGISADGAIPRHQHTDIDDGGKLDKYLTIVDHATTPHPLGIVVPHDEHSKLSGLDKDDHVMYLRADGSRPLTGDLVPYRPGEINIGAPTNPFKTGYFSTLDSVVFREDAVSLLGGWLMIAKDQATLTVKMLSTDVQGTFSKAMTPGDFILFRAYGKTEYMKVGAKVTAEPTDYTYYFDGVNTNGSRDLDGDGAQEWPDGTPCAVLGVSGDGRIEFSAYDTPRISIMKQGDTATAFSELVRIGDLNGSFGITNSLYGIGIGDYAASNYLRYDPTDGFVLKGGGGAVSIGADGITFGEAYDKTGCGAIHWGDASVYSFPELSYEGEMHGEGVLKLEAYSESLYGAGHIRMEASSQAQYQSVFAELSESGFSVTKPSQSDLKANISAGNDILAGGGLRLGSGSETPAAGEIIQKLGTVRELSSVPNQPAAGKTVMCNLRSIVTFRSTYTSMNYSPLSVPHLLLNSFGDTVRFALYGLGQHPTLGSVYRDLSGMGNHFRTTWTNGYSTSCLKATHATQIYKTQLLGTSDYMYFTDANQFSATNYLTYTIGWHQDPLASHFVLGTQGATTPSFRMTVETNNTIKVAFWTSTGQALSFSSSNTVQLGRNVASFTFIWNNSSSYYISIWLNGAATVYASTAPTGTLRSPSGHFRMYNDGSFTPSSACFAHVFSVLAAGAVEDLYDAQALLYNLIR